MSDDELLFELEHRSDELVEDPIIVVECGHSSQIDPTVLEPLLAGLPAILIATGTTASQPVAQVLDIVATTSEEVDRCERAVAQHRDAAVALAVLLRGWRPRSVREGLVAESATYSMLQGGPDHRRWLADQPSRGPLVADVDEVVSVGREGDRLRITLNRPHSRNAFNAAMRDALLEALAVVAADQTLTATIDATGGSFCSGGDLREFGTAEDPATAHLLRLRRNVGRAIDEVSDRVTVEVHGHCVGAGVELPSFADCVIAKPDAMFCLPELRMGLIPGAGGTVSIPRRIGRQLTFRLALWGEPIDATVALEWGLVDAIA